MPQKIQRYKNTNDLSKTFGKFYVRAVYDKKFITTSELADFIQTQCTAKRSDIKAVLDELGAAFKHYFELGQKIQLDGIGIFKVGVSSSPADTLETCGANNVKNSRVLFLPETTSVPTGTTKPKQVARIINGVATIVTEEQPVYTHPSTMLKDIRFEVAQNANGSGIEASDGGGGGDDDGDDEPRP